MRTQRVWAAYVMASAAAIGAAAADAEAHGTTVGSRIGQVRAAGPNGSTPAAWNESYYNWNENSRNFADYAQPGFTYQTYVPDGLIASAGVADVANATHRFAGTNTPSDRWATTSVTAGAAMPVSWLASAPHDPSYFDLWVTKQGTNVTTAPLAWGQLTYLGRWAVGGTALGKAVNPAATVAFAGKSPADNSNMPGYQWSTTIPADLSGRHALLTVWQREDPAGESFWSVQDLAVTDTPEPTALAAAAPAAGLLLARRRRPRRA